MHFSGSETFIFIEERGVWVALERENLFRFSR